MFFVVHHFQLDPKQQHETGDGASDQKEQEFGRIGQRSAVAAAGENGPVQKRKLG